MTHVIYAYRPLSLRSVGHLINYELLGQTARYERYTANLAYVMACGEKIDKDRSESFGKQVDEIYKNPFQKQGPQTREEIEQYLLKRLTE